jgi:signal transduction histidine kinase
VSWRRVLAAGLTVAAVAGIVGGAIEWRRFGPTTASASQRVEAAVRSDFDRMNAALGRVAGAIANDPATAAALVPGAAAERALFDIVARARGEGRDANDISVTIYNQGETASAWGGRPSDIPRERIAQPAAFFVKPSPLGLRLVHLLPISAPDGRRLGAVAAEHVLSPAPAAATITPADYVIATPVAPAALRMRWEGAGDRVRPGAFVLRAPDGAPLVEASVAEADLRAARAAHRHRTGAIALACCAVTILLLIGPLLDRRAPARQPVFYVRYTILALGLLAGGTLLLWLAVVQAIRHAPPTAITLLLAGFAAASSVALLAGAVTRLRVVTRADRREPAAAPLRFILQHLGAGALVTILYLLFARLLEGAVDPVTVDLRHFSLHPWNMSRIMLLGGILAFHMAILWAATLVLTAVRSIWRIPRGAVARRAFLVMLWLLPAAAGAFISASRGWPTSIAGLLLSASLCALAALTAQRVIVWYRHATLAARILALFVTFLVPALLLYPAMNFLAERATRRLITTQYAVEAQHHPQTLLDRLYEAQHEIDAVSILPTLVTGERIPGQPRPESAFLVWSQTALARARLTSAVELYDRQGALVSRFALNFPEYTGTAQTSQTGRSCTWEVFGEAARFGAEERRMLHAERRICAGRAPGSPPETLGSIVLHVAFDYRTLPFITSQSPYFEVFRPAEAGAPREGTAGGDVVVAIYGWGLRPLYASAPAAWPITGELFTRIYASRDSFWADVSHGESAFRVYFSNDRYGIYAIGYPRLTLFDHLVHLAELTTLAGAGFLLVMAGTALFTRIARERPRVGRALLREIRASFYRKLLLAFVLAAIVPVLILALVIRTYFANLLLDDVEAAAARTAAVAQRVVEESDALASPIADGVTLFSDDVMIWVSQLIDQDVNVFEGANLLATSERDLFASGLLPTRTPDDVYRAIALDLAPSYVREDRIGTFSYMIAATPVRVRGADAILTVPLATRQREIEREIDDLDRGVHLASLFFILLGAGIGLSMAERIADPVKRLTRATQQIARGDFDARIAVRSADELRRLVDAFNSMAAELKAQRTQLERTHRLEAWAEMARQVAHEIKNPLTPIQLSAEHLRRVHVDRGEPLGGVLDTCVTSILAQVRLLRQISAEFSSFASAPTARPSPVDVPTLIAEVVDPYRTGLSGRIEIVNQVAAPLPAVYVDRTLIARALSNIVENALHAMPRAGTLTIDAEATDSQVLVRVADTGVGMDDEALDRVFEPYFSTKTTGTGLGLPIARRNVEISGGTIEVASTKGVGTTVTMKLPMARE